MPDPNGNVANDSCGWASRFRVFENASLTEIIAALEAFVRDATPEQSRAWRATVPGLQDQCARVSKSHSAAISYGAVLEYCLPDGLNRVDAVLLVSGAVLVIELKGDGTWQPSYREQAADYARRLSWFHVHCAEQRTRVHTILASYGSVEEFRDGEFLTETRIEHLHDVVRRFDQPADATPISVESFIAPNAYQPAPSLVQAVRSYYATHELPRIKRIDAITRGAYDCVLRAIRDAHVRQSRKLILLSGVPGAGKTFVGLEVAHERSLDDLAAEMPAGGKPSAPAVFLSGNKPLVEVLQYELRRAGGDGRVFVRNVKDFVAKYSKQRAGAPPHHVLIFDEAQRAWDANKVREAHDDSTATSEPETFLRIASRVPDWAVVFGLIGEGQQIYTGEEGGIELWADAVTSVDTAWEVVGPERYRQAFENRNVNYSVAEELHLSRSVRFHFAAGLSEWAAGIVEGDKTPEQMIALANGFIREGYQLQITRDLEQAKEVLWDKYRDQPDARFGLMISGRDKGSGITAVHARKFRAGPWYADPDSSPASCRRLTDAITEFSSQGLELDHTLLVWGTDFIRRDGTWDDSRAKRYQRKGSVRNPLQLRRNAYRVLLTRGREGVVICLPKSIRELDETYDYLVAAGCRALGYAREVSVSSRG